MPNYCVVLASLPILRLWSPHYTPHVQLKWRKCLILISVDKIRAVGSDEERATYYPCVDPLHSLGVVQHCDMHPVREGRKVKLVLSGYQASRATFIVHIREFNLFFTSKLTAKNYLAMSLHHLHSTKLSIFRASIPSNYSRTWLWSCLKPPQCSKADFALITTSREDKV